MIFAELARRSSPNTLPQKPIAQNKPSTQESAPTVVDIQIKQQQRISEFVNQITQTQKPPLLFIGRNGGIEIARLNSLRE